MTTAQTTGPRPAETAPRSAPKKLLSIMSGLMDIMVDGLAPGVKQERRTYELVIVGAGPAGTAAAVRAASEGVDTLIIEAGQANGGAHFIECVDDCAAGAEGVTMGGWTSGLVKEKAHRFLVNIRQGLAVTGLREHGGHWEIETNLGHQISAKSVILAPGMRRRRLNVPGETELAGLGVHACAVCEGPAYAAKDVVVVGAGDLGIQQALHLATFAKSVTVAERSAGATCSRELLQRAGEQSNIKVKFDCIVREFKGREKLDSVLVEDAKTGAFEELYAAAAFLNIGLEPATGAFRTLVVLDQNGFIKTNRMMQTNRAGVFAAGHACSNRVQGPDDAAAEGYKAATWALRYLEKARSQPRESV